MEKVEAHSTVTVFEVVTPQTMLSYQELPEEFENLLV